MTLPPKLKEVLTSKKFWAMVAALAVIVFAVTQGNLPYAQAIQDAIAVVGAYIVAVGIEDNGKAQNP